MSLRELLSFIRDRLSMYPRDTYFHFTRSEVEQARDAILHHLQEEDEGTDQDDSVEEPAKVHAGIGKSSSSPGWQHGGPTVIQGVQHPKEPKKLDWSNGVRTAIGLEAEVLKEVGNYLVGYIVEPTTLDPVPMLWQLDGSYSATDRSNRDLLPIPREIKLTGFLNVYEDDADSLNGKYWHPTKERAINAGKARTGYTHIACIDLSTLTVQEGQGL